jgi:predicted RNA-binding protein YlxR (DUF448 family)
VVAAAADGVILVRPDPRRCLPGRGAWLHWDPACCDQAERRKAFGRALRVGHRVDLTELRAYLRHQSSDTRPAPSGAG